MIKDNDQILNDINIITPKNIILLRKRKIFLRITLVVT